MDDTIAVEVSDAVVETVVVGAGVVVVVVVVLVIVEKGGSEKGFGELALKGVAVKVLPGKLENAGKVVGNGVVSGNVEAGRERDPVIGVLL